jgi:predicted nucleic acid-binding Zn ribbon protein
VTRPREGGFESISPVLARMLSGLKLEERFASAHATELWNEQVTPEMKRRTRAVGVRDGELLVEVRGSVWMGHLAVLRQQIMDDINARLPIEARLRAIRLTPMRSREEGALEPDAR